MATLIDPRVGQSKAEPRWYAAKTHPGRERLAQTHLMRQDFETYLPLSAPPPRKARRGPVGPVAFFPGYIFVRLDLDHQRWHAVNSTRGVTRLVQFGERPTPVPETLIPTLQAATNADGLLGFMDALAPGDEVRLVGGAFDQQVGQVLRAGADQRVTVLLNLMHREVRLTVPRSGVLARELA